MAFKMRRSTNAGSVLMAVVSVILTLYVADAIIKAVANSVGNIDNSTFKSAFNFIGITMNGTAIAISTSGILAVVGLIAFAVIITRFVRFS